MQLHGTNFNFKKDGFSYERIENGAMNKELPRKVNNYYAKVFFYQSHSNKAGYY